MPGLQYQCALPEMPEASRHVPYFTCYMRMFTAAMYKMGCCDAEQHPYELSSVHRVSHVSTHRSLISYLYLRPSLRF